MASPEKTLACRKGRPSSRDAILDAALAVIADVGAGRMTLEAVAERAGISKGGLLYNFPSKDALLREMVQRFINRTYEREAELRGAGLPDLVAFLQARLYAATVDRNASNALLAALASSPPMLEPVRQAIRERSGRIARESADPDGSRIRWLALEGLLFQEGLGVSPFTDEERQRLIDRILAGD